MYVWTQNTLNTTQPYYFMKSHESNTIHPSYKIWITNYSANTSPVTERTKKPSQSKNFVTNLRSITIYANLRFTKFCNVKNIRMHKLLRLLSTFMLISFGLIDDLNDKERLCYANGRMPHRTILITLFQTKRPVLCFTVWYTNSQTVTNQRRIYFNCFGFLKKSLSFYK